MCWAFSMICFSWFDRPVWIFQLKRFAICLIFTAILIHHFNYHFNSKWNRLSYFSVVAIEVHQIRAHQQEKECLEQFSMWAICKLFWLLFLGEVSSSSYCFYVGEFNRAWRGFIEANLCSVWRIMTVANRAFTYEMKRHFTGK